MLKQCSADTMVGRRAARTKKNGQRLRRIRWIYSQSRLDRLLSARVAPVFLHASAAYARSDSYAYAKMYRAAGNTAQRTAYPKLSARVSALADCATSQGDALVRRSNGKALLLQMYASFLDVVILNLCEARASGATPKAIATRTHTAPLEQDAFLRACRECTEILGSDTMCNEQVRAWRGQVLELASVMHTRGHPRPFATSFDLDELMAGLRFVLPDQQIASSYQAFVEFVCDALFEHVYPLASMCSVLGLTESSSHRKKRVVDEVHTTDLSAAAAAIADLA